MIIIKSLVLIPMIVLSRSILLSKSNFDSSTLAYATVSYTFSNISGTYSIPDLGFQITFPPGWSGIGLEGFVMVSPMGINSRTAVPNPSDDLDRVILILSRANLSDVSGDGKDHNTPTYRNYVEKTAKTIGCRLVSDKFVKFASTTSEQMIQQCGPQLEDKTISYAISSGKSIVLLGLKGGSSAVDHNLQKFEQSLRAIKIDKVTDNKDLLFGSDDIRHAGNKNK
jgi:hypothetical protein